MVETCSLQNVLFKLLFPCNYKCRTKSRPTHSNANDINSILQFKTLESKQVVTQFRKPQKNGMFTFYRKPEEMTVSNAVLVT